MHTGSNEGDASPIGLGRQEGSQHQGGMQELSPGAGCSGTAIRDQRKMLPEACILKGNSDVSHVPFLLHTCGELSKAGTVSAPTLK